MKRETGYYWVKTRINTSNWRLAHWHTNYGGVWTWIAGTQDYSSSMKQVVEINETRILNPDEKAAGLVYTTIKDVTDKLK